MKLFEALQKFLMYLTITRAMSSRTVEQYGRHMWNFLSFVHPEVRKVVPKGFDLASFFSSQVSITPKRKIEASFEGMDSRIKSENDGIWEKLEKMDWISTEHIDQHICDHFRLSLAQ